MAEKEATIFIVDVGRPMGEKHLDRSMTDLEWSMQYVWDSITTAVATGRKTLFTGLIGLRTDETKNMLSDGEGYENLSILQPLSQILMPDICNLRNAIHVSRTVEGDPISALVLAIELIMNHCKKLKYIRRVILVTNGRDVSMDAADVQSIIDKLKAEHIELTVLGVDFDDPEYGFKEESKDLVKAGNEEVLRNLADGCNGIFGTMSQAIEELDIPRVKSVKPVVSYKGELTLGDPKDFESTMRIGVERYPRTMIAKPPTASQYVVATKATIFKGDDGKTQSEQSSMTLADEQQKAKDSISGEKNGENLAAVKNMRKYQVDDDTTPGTKKDVDVEDLAKGYEYGRTAVHISESDQSVTTFETVPGFEIIGFIPQEKYERFMSMSRTNVIVAQRNNEKASMAFSSLIHALYELEIYAVARLVTKVNVKPLILLLAPSIEQLGGETDAASNGGGFECLTDVELPFAEDLRQYKFPPLDRVKTVSGKTLTTEHRNLPDDRLRKAMSDYVDQMNLDEFGQDEDGNPVEYAPLEDTYSPVLHRVLQVIRRRAVLPNEEISAVPEILIKWSKVPESLAIKTKPYLEALTKAAEVKKVPPRAKGRKHHRPTDEPLSGLDVDALLGAENRRTPKSTKISRDNAIPEFKQLLASTEDAAAIKDVAAQMGDIIRTHIRYSVGDSGYGRAIEAMRVMREEMLELEEPEVWNDFIKALKRDLIRSAECLGGERREMWWLARGNRLGLIDKRASDVSDVSEEEAREFLKAT